MCFTPQPPHGNTAFVCNGTVLQWFWPCAGVSTSYTGLLCHSSLSVVCRTFSLMYNYIEDSAGLYKKFFFAVFTSKLVLSASTCFTSSLSLSIIFERESERLKAAKQNCSMTFSSNVILTH